MKWEWTSFIFSPYSIFDDLLGHPYMQLKLYICMLTNPTMAKEQEGKTWPKIYIHNINITAI